MVLGVFVKTTVRRRGDKEYRYLSLVEAVRVDGRSTHRTLLRLGEASELAATGQLDRIIAALRTHASGTWLSAAEIESTGARAVGGVAAVRSYWSRLGLDEHFSGPSGAWVAPAVFTMVANRLIDPCAKRRLREWASDDVVLGVEAPADHRYYRALDAVAEAKPDTERHLYARLCDLTNLDLRLVCYDLTSTYFEGDRRRSDRFASRAFGYSRDHRGDRPQIVIGLLVTTDGIPIAHHVFAGNTADVSTLPAVLDDLQARFGVGAITMVADRGLISAENVKALADKGFGHILATRLHRDHDTAAALEASTRIDAAWHPCPEASSAVCDVAVDGRRFVVVLSVERHRRDVARTAELVERTSKELRALEERVQAGRVKDRAKIGASAGRILARSGVARLFDWEITSDGQFLYHYDEAALDYEERLLAGRYALGTSLSKSQASAPDVLRAYRRLLEVESSFRVLKSVLELRPVFHWTEDRVRGHVAVCVLASVIEALMEADLRSADVRDPDVADQVISPRRAMVELGRIRQATIVAGERSIDVVTRRSPLQARVLAAFGVDTTAWDRARIS